MPLLRAALLGALVLLAIRLERFEGRGHGRAEDSFLLLSLTLVELGLEQLDLFAQATNFALLFQTAFAKVDSIIARFVKLILHAVSSHRVILSGGPSGSTSLNP